MPREREARASAASRRVTASASRADRGARSTRRRCAAALPLAQREQLGGDRDRDRAGLLAAIGRRAPIGQVIARDARRVTAAREQALANCARFDAEPMRPM